MKSTLVDAGPLIALFDKRDQYHLTAINFLKGYSGNLLTTWPVITEASHMLSFSTNAQVNLLTWMQRGGLQISDLDQTHLVRLIELSQQFSDVPMDLADASLIVASEKYGIREIASIDSDFYVYRDIRNQFLVNVFPRQS
ncbi:MAG: pilus assembly protein [Tunicatimonas sp.]|uniref:type II toxin-antitoxin system VapC family toxin n=1 Tax=Tunicatimonas sp. TaxID=1940096 RepID=UPI003C729946